MGRRRPTILPSTLVLSALMLSVFALPVLVPTNARAAGHGQHAGHGKTRKEQYKKVREAGKQHRKAYRKAEKAYRKDHRAARKTHHGSIAAGRAASTFRTTTCSNATPSAITTPTAWRPAAGPHVATPPPGRRHPLPGPAGHRPGLADPGRMNRGTRSDGARPRQAGACGEDARHHAKQTWNR